MKIKAIIAIVLCAALTVSFVGCKTNKKEKIEVPAKSERVIAAEIKRLGDRMVPYHNGKPYLFLPIHLRYDHIKSTLPAEQFDETLETAMKKVKESGFKAVMLYIRWTDIYDGKKYDLTILEKQFKLAEKYDLYVHIVWFGSNICGFGGYMPWQNDYEKYPSLKDENGNSVMGTGYAAGKRIPDFSVDIFAKEECEALNKVCEWLYLNDKDCRTVAIQLQDEPDGDGGGYGRYMSQFETYVDYLNKLGKAVKESRYSMITYANITLGGMQEEICNLNYKERVRLIYNQEYIDFVGVSYYGQGTTPKVKEFEQEGNYPAFIGFGAGPYSLPTQLLYALSNGYGVCPYQVINLVNNQDSGLFRCQGGNGLFVERDGTQNFVGDGFDNVPELKYSELVDTNKSIQALAELLAVNNTKNMKVYNNQIKLDAEDTKKIDGEKITYKFKDLSQRHGGAGLLIKAADGNFYGFSTQTASFTFESEISSVTEGYYENGKWMAENKVTVNNNTFTAEGSKAYQIILK